MEVKKAITINRPAEELYAYWHDFENLPRFMEHLQAVQVTGGGAVALDGEGAGRPTVEWDAEIVEDRPNELIAWRSLEGATVTTPASVRFAPAPGDRGTEVHVDAALRPAGRRARRDGGQALRRGAGAAGARRPAPLQAGHGDGRDHAVGCQRQGRRPGATARRGPRPGRIAKQPERAKGTQSARDARRHEA